jgi:hypothetical protein
MDRKKNYSGKELKTRAVSGLKSMKKHILQLLVPEL